MKTAHERAEEPPGSKPNGKHPQEITKHTEVTPASRLLKSRQTRERSQFRVSERSREFLRKFYPDASLDEWNDWRWQNRNRVRTLADLERMIELSPEELGAIKRHSGALPLGIVPYYASLLEPNNPMQGLRRTVVPVLGEYDTSRGENEDPLGEDTPQPGTGPGASLSRPRPAAGNQFLFGLLPLLHPCPHGWLGW